MVFAGSYIDPFVSLMKDSCDGNTWIVFEGNELRCRALKNINANTELTISRIRPLHPNFEGRCLEMDILGINCECELCQNPSPEPEGDLKSRLSKYRPYPDKRIVYNDMCLTLDQLQEDIKSMTNAGFGFATVPMLLLHKLAMDAYMVNSQMAEALKLALKIFFVVEPAQVPSILPPLHLFTWYQILNIVYYDAFRSGARQPLPNSIRLLLERHETHIHLRYKLVLETAKCFGENSAIFRHEKTRFESHYQILHLHLGVVPAAYIPLSESASNRIRFIGAMRKLLEWADVEGVSDEDLF